jgi:hypothetical protein
MKKNLGSADKVVRILLAAIIVVLFATHILTGMLGILLLAVAAVLVLTSFISFCPLYYIFGLRTNKKKE